MQRAALRGDVAGVVSSIVWCLSRDGCGWLLLAANVGDGCWYVVTWQSRWPLSRVVEVPGVLFVSRLRLLRRDYDSRALHRCVVVW